MPAGESQVMTVSEIDALLPLWRDHWDPASRRRGNWLDHREGPEARLRRIQGLRDRPDFGWATATRIYELGAETCPPEAAFWVQHAVRLLAGRKDGRFNGAIRSALAIRSNPELAQPLEAALIAADATAARIALPFGIPEIVVNAYDSLFFNILDRQSDRVYAAGLIRSRYPEYRLDCPASTETGSHFLELGFKRSLEEILVLSGVQDADIRKLTELAAREFMRVQVGVGTPNPPPKINPTVLRDTFDRMEAEQAALAETTAGSSMGQIISAQLEEDRSFVLATTDAEARASMETHEPP